jgi:hypothetical protein
VPRPVVPLVATFVWGVLIFPGLLGAALSPMFFDAPGSESNPAAWTNALIVISFPVLCGASIAASWLTWSWLKRRGRARVTSAAVVVACVPLLPIAYFGVAMIAETAGVLTSGQPMGLHSTIIRH